MVRHARSPCCRDDLVVCVLRGGFGHTEQTLLDGGRGGAVIRQRMECHGLMRGRFIGVIDAATGQRVLVVMSGHRQDPAMMSGGFVLAPTDRLGEAGT